MSRQLCTFAVSLALLSAPALAFPASGSPRPGNPPATPVLVVGTIHGNHGTNTNYTYEHLVQILTRFKPDVICVEIRPSDFRKVPYLKEMMVATTYGFKRGLKVYPIDWWDENSPARQERDAFTKTPEYAEKSAREKQMIAESAVARTFVATYGDDEPRLFQERGPEFFNGPDYNGYIADKYRISMAVYGDHSMNLYYETRNRKMTDLIAKAVAENPGKRIAVLSGGEHKHYFDRSLAALAGVEIVRFESLLPLKPVTIDPEITALLTKGIATLYYDTSTPEGIDDCYAGALVPLVHGPGMDFLPEKVPAANVDKAKEIIDEWTAKRGSTTRIRYEIGWYHFLKGDTRQAIADIEAVVTHIAEIEPARMRPIVLRTLGFCYDIAGQREKALAAYDKGEQASAQAGFPPNMVKLLFDEYKTKPYPGRQGK